MFAEFSADPSAAAEGDKSTIFQSSSPDLENTITHEYWVVNACDVAPLMVSVLVRARFIELAATFLKIK